MKKSAISLALVAAAVVIMAVVTVTQHPSAQSDPTGAPTGDATLSAASSVTSELSGAGLVDGRTVDATAVETMLSGISATTATPTTDYDRDSFGPAWADTDQNGCDQRNDVLARDMTRTTFEAGTHDCVVLTGTLNDAYTGKTIVFTRGERTSMAVQIDHIVPLSWAFQHGAASWTKARREQLATDLTNLQAVDGPTNESKSDQGPATWVPSNTAYDCTYVTRFTFVVHRYDLTIDTADRNAIDRVLDTCK